MDTFWGGTDRLVFIRLMQFGCLVFLVCLIWLFRIFIENNEIIHFLIRKDWIERWPLHSEQELKELLTKNGKRAFWIIGIAAFYAAVLGASFVNHFNRLGTSPATPNEAITYSVIFGIVFFGVSLYLILKTYHGYKSLDYKIPLLFRNEQ